MRGLLGDKLFADLVRDLSRQGAAGGLTITRDGEAIEVFFESGVPVLATATVPDEQIECWLVRDGLVSAEQIKTAWLAARDSLRTLDEVLVQDGIVPAATLAEAQRDGSRRAVNLAFQWYTGDYNFDPQSCCSPVAAKLSWSAAECILKGARHASGNDTILDAIAPDYLIVAPVQEGAEQSATLNSVEGYVLSCIQSPISVWDASGLTGLPHKETRRAVFVLILLGLIERQSIPDHVVSDLQSRLDTSVNHDPPDQATCQQQSSSDQGASELSSPAVQWCAVEYASGDGRFQDQYRVPSSFEADGFYDDNEISGTSDSSPLDQSESNIASLAWDEPDSPAEDAFVKAAERPIALIDASTVVPDSTSGFDQHAAEINEEYSATAPPFTGSPAAEGISGMLTSEEAAYQQKLFLEEKLDHTTIAEPRREPVVPVTATQAGGNPKSKSLTNAIQELNIRLRLAGSPTPDTSAEPTQLTWPHNLTGQAIDDEAHKERESLDIVERPTPWDDAIVSESEQITGQMQVTEPVDSAEPVQIAEQVRIAEPVGPAESGQSVKPEPPIDEEPILQHLPTFDEPLRIGLPPTDNSATPAENLIAPNSPVPPIPVGGAATGNNRETETSHGTADGASADMQSAHPAQTDGASLPHRDTSGDERFLKKIVAKLDARLTVASSSNYYQLLGIDRLASNGKITESYEEMVALYGGYKTRWPEDVDLQSKITELMSKVKRAYETLGDVERRRVYDLPSAKEQGRQGRNTEAPGRPNPRPLKVKGDEPGEQPLRKEAPPTTTVQPGDFGSALDRQKPSQPPASNLHRKSKRSLANTNGAEDFKPDLRNPYEAAEEYYKRGRALYERMDLHTAAHVLKEAIKLDPNRSSYYYQLGLVLSTLSQARKEHKHHKGCHVTCRLGGFLARNQRVRREAERHLLKAAELDPSNPEIKLKLGTLYKEASLDQKAQQYFYEALMLDANCELAKLELGLDREAAPEQPVEPGLKKPRRRSRRH